MPRRAVQSLPPLILSAFALAAIGCVLAGDAGTGTGLKNTLSVAAPVLTVPLDLPALPADGTVEGGWTRALAAAQAGVVPQAWLILGPRPDQEFKLYARPRGLEPDGTDDWSLVPLDESGQPFRVMLWTRPQEEGDRPAAAKGGEAERGDADHVDLAQILGCDGKALAYARTEVDWPVAGEALLWYDADGRSLVYLNNQVVLKDEHGDWQNGRYCLPVKLQKGRNVLKIKAGQHAGAWGFHLRLERNDPEYRIAVLARLLGLFPDQRNQEARDACLEIARRYEGMQRTAEAGAAYRKTQHLFADDEEAGVAAAKGLLRLKEDFSPSADPKQNAWKDAEKSVNSLLGKGHAADADGVLRDFLARYPLHELAGRALVLRGALRADCGLAGDARAYYERALREAPHHRWAMDQAVGGLAFARGIRPLRPVYETAHEVQTAIAASRRLLSTGNREDIERALRNVGECLGATTAGADDSRAKAGSLIRVSDSVFFPRHAGALEYVRAALASLNPSSRAVYGEAVAAAAGTRLRLARASGDILALQSLACQYPYTPAAATALNAAGNLALDRGAFGEAASLFSRLQDDQTALAGGIKGATAMVAAKRAHALVRDGQTAAAREVAALLRERFGPEKLAIAGTEMTGVEYARTVEARCGTAGQASSSTGPSEPGEALWVRTLPFSPAMTGARALCDWNPFITHQSQPVLADGRLFASTQESLQAFDALTGGLLWRRVWGGEQTNRVVPGAWPPASQFAGFPVSCPTVHSGRVHMRSLDGSRSALRCYAASDGALCWGTDGHPRLRTVVWLSDPVITCGLAIAPFLEPADEIVNTHGLAALDAATGELRWLRVLVNGQACVRVGTQHPALSLQTGPPAARDGIVYAPTGLGSLAAVNAFSGDPIWLSGYPCLQTNDLARGNTGAIERLQARIGKLYAREACAPLVVGDVVVFAPKEGPGLLAFDRRTGELRWRRELDDSRFLAGISDGNVLVCDDTVHAVRAATGGVVWEYTVPSGLWGRPGLADGVLYLPSRDALHLVDARTGTLRTSVPWDTRLGPLANLVVADGRIAGVTGESTLATLGRRGTPRIVLPLEDGRALTSGGKFADAAAAYERAASNPDSVLEGVCGRVKALRAAGRLEQALGDVERLLGGKPAVLQSADGAWRVARDVLKDGLRASLGGGEKKNANASATATGLAGALTYAWRLPMDKPQMSLPPDRTGSASDIVFAYAGHTLYAARLGERPEPLWQRHLGLDNARLAFGATAIAANAQGRIVCVDRATGERLWAVSASDLLGKGRPEAPTQFHGCAVGDDAVAAVAADVLLCLDLATGAERWRNKKAERRVRHLAFLDGKLAEIQGAGNHPLVHTAYDPRTGAVLTTKELGEHTVWTWAAVAPDGSRAAYRTGQRTIACVNVATGDVLWETKGPFVDYWPTSHTLSWESGMVCFRGEDKERADRSWVVCELNPDDGVIRRAYDHAVATFGDSVLAAGEAGWGKLGFARHELQKPTDGMIPYAAGAGPGGFSTRKRIWSTVLAREQAEGGRMLAAFVFSGTPAGGHGERLYIIFERQAASPHLLLRTFDWANGQLLDEEIMAGAPFAFEGWDKPYRGTTQLAGGLLLYTAADGIYAYTGRAPTRTQTAALLRASLQARPEAQKEAAATASAFWNVAGAGAAHSDRRRALACAQPEARHALLAPRSIRVDGDLGEWDQSTAFALSGLEYFAPSEGGEQALPLPPPAGGGGNDGWRGPDDLSARVAAAWDQNGVYVAVDVRDDQTTLPASPALLRTGDHLRVAVNATPDTRWGYDQRLTAVCDVALVDGQAVVQVENAGGVDIEDRGTAARPVAAVRRAPDGGGLRYELLLPWALLRPDPALRPGDRRELRMEIAVRDNDGGVLKGAMAWGAGCLVDETPLPQWMGQLYLLDISAERIERYRKVVARIPDMPETRSYLQMILASMRGPRAAQDQLAELQSFVKTHPASRNTPRALMTIRTLQKELGEADPHARTAAVAREAGCPAPVVEWIMGKRQEQDRGSGLEAEYYDNADFTDLKITRVDPEINFDWTTKPPGGAMGPDHFSVRWTGQVKPRYSEKYTFFTRSDDGVRLWVDDKLLVDNWTDHAATEDSGEIALIAGMKYDVKLEYYQGGGNAIIALGWASANQKQEVIPHECLFAGDMPPAPATGEAPNKATEEQAAYRDAARLLPDAPEGWALLRQVLARYPADAQETRTTECIRYLKEFPDSVNAVAIMQALRGWYTKPNAPDRAAAAHAARKACEEIMESCKLPRDARRAFYRDCVPAWDQWHALGPVQAGGDQRGMEEVMEPERGVNLAWQAKGPLDVPLVWIKIQRLKDEWRTNGVTDLYQWLVGRLPPEKRNEFDRAPYFAYAWRTVNCPTARRATLFFGVNDTVSIWLNRQRIVTQSSPGATKDGRAIEINLRQGENEILLKAGTPAWGRLHFFLRIADPDGRPFEDLPTE